jgi:hypothetical protein
MFRKVLHILKFICLNTIAVRTICKKHDRLSMNRMLGGYYHKTRQVGGQDKSTLGSLVSSVAGGLFEAHPSAIALANHGKLLGVLDLKIQQLANSRTVKTVSSCLALALSEYEVSQYRADALAKLSRSNEVQNSSDVTSKRQWKNPFSMGEWAKRSEQNSFQSPSFDAASPPSDYELGDGPPSTTSAISLARLQFSVLSIAALREASRVKANPFFTYLGRASMSFTGKSVIGEGLDGSSRDSLDFLLSFNPDSALLLDTTSIHEGLQHGRWKTCSLGDAMRHSLAVALTLPSDGPNKAPMQVPSRELHHKEWLIAYTLGILPKSDRLFAESSIDDNCTPTSLFTSIAENVDFPPVLVRANRWCWFLYNVSEGLCCYQSPRR